MAVAILLISVQFHVLIYDVCAFTYGVAFHGQGHTKSAVSLTE